MPYLGFIETTIALAAPGDINLHCLLLVVPDSEYSSHVPVLIGTNIITELMEVSKDKLGEKYLQNSSVSTPWFLAFRCITLREKALKKNNNRLALIKSAEKRTIIIKPNSTTIIRGCLKDKMEYQPTSAVMEATSNSAIPKDFDITPILTHYSCNSNGFYDVYISNITTRTLPIHPHTILCELQPVVVENNVLRDEIYQKTSLEDKVNIESSALTETQIKEVRDLVNKYEDVFSKSETDIGHYSGVTHKINLTDETPFKQRYRRIPPKMIDEVRSHLDQLLSAGIIRKSFSPFASNIVTVRKKSGKLRICADFRFLNKRTIKDSYALPRIDDILDTLSGSKFFSVLDMKSGFHQVEIEERHKQRTAFTVGPLGFYEYNRLPMGLCNSPATYQRLMEECLGDLNMKICIIYLDDIIIFAKTFEEHMERLEIVLQRLRECRLKLAAEKCEFLKKKVKYVGYIVSEDGISTDPDKVEKILDWPRPTNPDEVRQFIGFAGFYRRFIKDFSKIIQPLSELMPPSSKKKSRRPKAPDNWIWKWDHEYAFNKLKDCMTSAPVLGYANQEDPFTLHIDASSHGLGAILYQKQEGKLRVISYASRSLNRAEKNYPAMKLEFLTLKWAVTEKFKDYLYGCKFDVTTDNNPLTYVLTTAKLDATGQRWISALATYDFSISYKPGRCNGDADALSRYPERCEDHIPHDAVKTICHQTEPYVHTITMSNVNLIEATNEADEPLSQMDMRMIRKEQREDDTLGYWVHLLTNRKKPCKNDFPNTRKHLALYRCFHNLHMVRGVLYRKIHEDDRIKQQMVLPKAFIESVLKGLHDDMGHPGKDKTLSLLRDRFYWPGMTADVDSWIDNCDRCLRSKSSTQQKAPLVSIKSTYPLEMVCMDYLSLEPTKGGITNVLVITDHFTRFAVAIPTKDQTAKTTAEAFFNEFVVHYGLPAKIHTDQGANFQSELFSHLCLLTGMEKSRTSPYHPMGNGLTERFNRTLISMLRTISPNQKLEWKKHIAPLVHAYNCMRHESTGFSPYELLFGRQPRLPIDLVFGINSESNKDSNMSDYIKELHVHLQESYKKAMERCDKAQAKQKDQFDKKARAMKLDIGDKVLVKNLAIEGKKKLSNFYEEGTSTVVQQINQNIPVYIVRSEDGKDRTLHRNHLFPVKTHRKPTPTPRKRKTQEKTPQTVVKDQDSDEDKGEETEEEEIFNIIYNPATMEPRTNTQEAERNNSDSEDASQETPNATEPQAIIEPPRIIPRRSTRQRRKPQWHQTYSMSMIDKTDAIRKLSESGFFMDSPRHITDMVIKAVL